MSADNWGRCPNCHKLAKQARINAYGKVSEDEYLALVEADENKECTLREDYGVYTDEDGIFTIGYRCGCEVCGFHFTYKYSQQVVKQEANHV